MAISPWILKLAVLFWQLEIVSRLFLTTRTLAKSSSEPFHSHFVRDEEAARCQIWITPTCCEQHRVACESLG
eukprot:s111_g24.t1